MADIQIEFDTQNSVLTLAESVTVEDIAAVHEAIVNMLQGSGQATINVSRMTHTDVFMLQLLCSAHLTANRMGKTITLDTGGCNIVWEVAQETGMIPSRGRCDAVDSPCLWATKNEI